MTKLFKGAAFCALMVVASNASFADTSRQAEVEPLKELLGKTNTFCVKSINALQCVLKDESLTAALRHCKYSKLHPDENPVMDHLCEADDVLKVLPFDRKPFEKNVDQVNKGYTNNFNKIQAHITSYVDTGMFMYNGKEKTSFADLDKAVKDADIVLRGQCQGTFRVLRDSINPVIQIYRDFKDEKAKGCEGI